MRAHVSIHSKTNMGVKTYFKRECQWSMFGLEEDNTSQFYVTCFQQNRSALPLLLIRLIVFLGCLGILLASGILTGMAMDAKYWFIFLTHWGLVFIALTALLGLIVSVRAYLVGPIDASFGLPWYVKAYWVTYNLSIPIAFFISLFYWSLLTQGDEEFAINFTLDVFIHGINSLLMLILVMTSSHPSRLLHFHHPILAGVAYLIFSIIYFYAGGVGPTGDTWIYPMLDWSNPSVAAITSIGAAVMILLMHFFVVALAAVRRAVTKERAQTLYISNDGYN